MIKTLYGMLIQIMAQNIVQNLFGINRGVMVVHIAVIHHLMNTLQIHQF